ncbi:MAG: methyltransferase domain-containing protein [Gammaproteobacteria bacterium]
MKFHKSHNLACPIDGARLEARDKQLVCANGHSFDIARQGYVNLLPVQHKRTRHPGDSKAMVSARTAFLNSGNYEPIARILAELVQTRVTARHAVDGDGDDDDDGICLLDAGCGEGYYFDYVFKVLEQSPADTGLCMLGLDISKQAILEAARRNKHISWIVGTNRQPPLLPASVDIILCVFGFQSFEGFEKVLKPGGFIVLVEPGPDHLAELREIIYSEVKKTPPPTPGHAQAHAKTLGYSLVENQSLQFKTHINSNAQINNLLIMTPHFYRASQSGREAAAQLQTLDLSIDIVFRVLQKDA